MNQPATAVVRNRLQRLISKVGLRQTGQLLGVNRNTLNNAAAGRPLVDGTRLLLEHSLDQLDLEIAEEASHL